MANLTRRQLMGGLAAGATATVLGAAQAAEGKTLKTYPNEHFYKDGAFDVATAKEAYYEMFRFYDYPIVPRLKSEEFWTLDFGLGLFTEVGMAGIFWINEQEGDYFGHEIFLLPGQMIPEHRHVKTADARPKMEGWQVRYGSILTFGESEDEQEGVREKIPPSHRECAHVRAYKELMPGEVDYLAAPGQWHFMLAGPQGAIVTEYASYHDGAALRFSHPQVSM